LATCFLDREEVQTNKEGNSTVYLKVKVMDLKLMARFTLQVEKGDYYQMNLSGVEGRTVTRQ